MKIEDLTGSLDTNKVENGILYVKAINDINIVGKSTKVYLDWVPDSKAHLVIMVGDTPYRANSENIPLRRYLTFSNFIGTYVITREAKDLLTPPVLYQFGSNRYPYTFAREYEAERHFDIFADQAKCDGVLLPDMLNDVKLKYTFGLEYETSAGFVPEHLCFKNGIIPLRDGSISGTEYSTIVMSGLDGIRLIKKQLDVLKDTTVFDKECSLHMHLGGYPVNEKSIFTLYAIVRKLEAGMYDSTIPMWSFCTGRYKKTGKEYCKKQPGFENFEGLYEYYTGTRYMGNLTQAHPSDPDKSHKWQVNGRYYALNLINMICYRSPKTVEFRFLKPTYNFAKILFWVLAFQAILAYSEKLAKSYIKNGTTCRDIVILMRSMPITLWNIIDEVYGGNTELVDWLHDMISRLRAVVSSQTDTKDMIGANTDLEDKIIGWGK